MNHVSTSVRVDGKAFIFKKKSKLCFTWANPSGYGVKSGGTILEQIEYEIWWTAPVLYRELVFQE
jgi:hypothetical protein